MEGLPATVEVDRTSVGRATLAQRLRKRLAHPSRAGVLAGIQTRYSQCPPALRCLLVFCLVYSVYVFANSAPVAAGADCGGYLGSAKLLAQGVLSTPLRTVSEFQPATPLAFTPHGYVPKAESETLVPTYPVGLPLHLAISARVLGWHWGPLCVQVLGAVLSVLLTYWLLREVHLPAAYAAIGAATLAISPLLLSVSYIPMSDGWATVWCTLAVIASFRGRKNPRWAEAAGAFMAIAALVRPNNLLILPVMAVAGFGFAPLARMIFGAAPILAAAALYNYVLYGSPLRTGYGAIGDTLSTQYIAASVASYAWTLPFVLPLAGGFLLLLVWRSRFASHRTWALLIWATTFAAFFSLYMHTPTHWWYTRFILPAFPAMIALGMMGWRSVIQNLQILRKRSALVLTVLLVAASCSSVYWAVIKKINRSAIEQGACRDTSEWIKAHLPANSLIACSYLSAAMYYYTELPILRWEYMSPEEFSKVESALAQSGRPLFIVLRAFEVKQAFEAMAGAWRPISSESYFSIWQLEPKSRDERLN